MKKILFLIVALGSMITCLFYAFDNSFFQKNEIEKIEEPKHQLIYDAGYDFSEDSLYFYRTTYNKGEKWFFDSERLRKGIINDTFKVNMAEVGAYVGITTDISIYEDSIWISDGVYYSCTGDSDYKLIYGKAILNQKPKVHSDLYVHFDMLFISKQKDENSDSLFIKGNIKLEELDTALSHLLYRK
ncbi:hypothetical protein WAF17_21240 [Bernardetia sp. ABR2-2B]|uniref:hypothetical protein n=1 Tax=Bernardetia sp. ABR2-2B TaxID=3127472 RepID=UPI0030D3A735